MSLWGKVCGLYRLVPAIGMQLTAGELSIGKWVRVLKIPAEVNKIQQASKFMGNRRDSEIPSL